MSFYKNISNINKQVLDLLNKSEELPGLITRYNWELTQEYSYKTIGGWTKSIYCLWRKDIYNTYTKFEYIDDKKIAQLYSILTENSDSKVRISTKRALFDILDIDNRSINSIPAYRPNMYEKEKGIECPVCKEDDEYQIAWR